ncbi:MAG: DUF3025 domain-containing protein [Rhodanobacteraceae bacterium]
MPLERATNIATGSTITPRMPPLFAGIAELSGGADVFPCIDDLNRMLASERRSGALRFAAQTPDLLADGLHYEERIARHGIIATRENTPHDAFNALIWLRHTELKRAMNARQVADIARVGSKERTRGQCALTHFDEAGAIVWIAARDALTAWDAHDWPALFRVHADEWGRRIAVTIVGHALYEYALMHKTLPVAKALVVAVDADDITARCTDGASIASWPEAERAVAEEIAAGRLLADPQELRPLPFAGIPAWQSAVPTDEFYRTTPCFRPLRAGRRYPSAAVLRIPTRIPAPQSSG